MKNKCKIEVGKDRLGYWRFRLIDQMGNRVATSESHATKAQCERAIVSLKFSAHEAEIVYLQT